jgi:FkbM family methyltransferase
MLIDKAIAVLDYYKAFGSKSFGILAGIISAPDGKTMEVRLPGAPGTLKLRKGTADENIFYQIFLKNECEQVFEIEPARILDCGAHIGCAAVYFARRFPKAEIVCIEPEPGNFALLQQNTAPYSQIRCVFGALTARGGERVRIANPEGPTYHYRVQSSSAGEIMSHSIEDLMSQSSWSHVDLLKLDIEGSERDVLAESRNWLKDIDVLVVELHDDIVPGCSKALYSALPDSYRQRVCGDHVVIRIGE